MAVVDDLLDEIFDGLDAGLRREFEGWVRDSRRFLQFATAYRTKIRSKLRQASDGERMQDVRAELEAAALFLSDRRFVLEYEAYAALKQRGPDFTVTYRENVRFNIEVRRLRSSGEGEVSEGKLVGVLAEKVGQMPPSVPNLLWLAAEEALAVDEAASALATLRLMAERKEEDFFRRRRFANAGAFVKQLSRLSGIVVRQAGRQQVWRNAGARHGLSDEVLRAVEGLSG